jgi:GNAT superfamily N-acetyltransferase
MASMWRAARPDEHETVVRLCVALNEEDPGVRPVPPDHMQRTLAMFRQEPWRGVAAVLEIEGRVSGYALLVSFWSNEIGGEIVVLDELYVEPAHRGQGLATQLIDELAAKRGPWPKPWRAIALEVTPANNRAMKLYQRLGFAGSNRTLRRLL